MFTPHTFLVSLVNQAGITDPVYANQAVLELEPVLLDRVMVSLMTHLSDDDQQTAYDIADL
jgi:hypothetical protein